MFPCLTKGCPGSLKKLPELEAVKMWHCEACGMVSADPLKKILIHTLPDGGMLIYNTSSQNADVLSRSEVLQWFEQASVAEIGRVVH